MSIANTEMAAAWDEEAPHWVEYDDAYERCGVELWPMFLSGVKMSAGDRVLDIGCGTGAQTRSLARQTRQGSVVGIDLSERMIDRARDVAAQEGMPNIEFLHGDVQVYPFASEDFDLAVSSFGAMFFADPVAAFGNVHKALRPGGRLALLVWRSLADNAWLLAIRAALARGRELPAPPPGAPGPFGLADPDHVRDVLGQAGFGSTRLDPLDAQIDLGADADAAYSYVSTMGITRGLTGALDAAERDLALTELRHMLESHETPSGVRLPCAAWRISAERL